MSGLPSDSVSIDNAIMSTRTAMWPLMIDPQQQANTWIKKRDDGLLVLKAASED
jgi:dynein heavy chain